MPSRKLTFHCPKCGGKNHLRAHYCNQCGGRLREPQARDQEGRAKLYADIAHPINAECRELIQNRVIEEFMAELERSGQPGYVSRYDEDYDGDYEPGDFAAETPAEERTLRADQPQRPPGPHVPEPEEKAPAEPPESRRRPAEQDRGDPPKPSSFGEGLFDKENP